MPAIKTVFTCQNCGYQTPKWLGRCPDCEKWNSFIEENYSETNLSYAKNATENPPQKISELRNSDSIRVKTGLSEFDRVLGGGIVSDSVILIGGEPGIGKSTLLMQIAGLLAKTKKVLYISGEESPSQIKMRAQRLEVLSEKLYILNETEVLLISKHIEKLKPDIVIADSIQVLYNENMTQSAGSVTQIRESACFLTAFAKKYGFSLFIVGHVTKDGIIAGPKILEHMVDCVVYFENQHTGAFRILRSIKNRFGSTNEIGIFHMTQKGLVEVSNPSGIFLKQGYANSPGSAIVSTMEGTRPILVEVQALARNSIFTAGRHRSSGIDQNRLVLLSAVLEKKLGINLAGSDIFVNIAGGIKIVEPASDLAVCMAIVSSFKDKPINEKTVFIGEVGLNGEIRTVSDLNARIKECARLGFEKCIIPKIDSNNTGKIKNMNIICVNDISETVNIIL